MNGGIRLGAIKGVEVVADASASVLALLFGAAVFVELTSDDLASSNERALVLSAIAGVLVVVGVLVHELAHAAVAKWKGFRVLGIRVFIFGGYSVIESDNDAMSEFQVAVAGPAASIALGFGLWAGALAVGTSGDIGTTARALAIANVAIGLFNLFPGFPLDGGRVARGLIAARTGDRVAATRAVSLIGRYTGWAVMAIGVGLVFTREGAGLFWIIGGWFLATTAIQTGRREELVQTFGGQTASDVMRTIDEAIPGSMPVKTMVDLYLMGPDLRTYPVDVEGRIVGVVGQAELDAVAPSRWHSLSVKRIMTAIGPDDVVEVDEPLENLLLRPSGRSGRVIVVNEGRAVGVIDAMDLGRAIAAS
jgi:Zn-dependent protease